MVRVDQSRFNVKDKNSGDMIIPLTKIQHSIAGAEGFVEFLEQQGIQRQ